MQVRSRRRLHAAACWRPVCRMLRAPGLLQLLAQLQQLDLQLPAAVVLEDVLVGLAVGVLLRAGLAAKLGHRRAAQIELVGLHMAAGARATWRQDAHSVVHGSWRSGTAAQEAKAGARPHFGARRA